MAFDEGQMQTNRVLLKMGINCNEEKGNRSRGKILVNEIADIQIKLTSRMFLMYFIWV